MFTVDSIFPSYMGEQNFKGIGHPVVFVRFSYCNLNCSYCDTPEARVKNSGENMSLEYLTDKVDIIREATGISDICFTGGEPMLQKDIGLLFDYYSKSNIFVETNGTINLEKHLKNRSDKLTFIIDYKIKSARISKQNLIHTFKDYLNEKDVIKFVINNFNDYIEAKGVSTQYEYKPRIVFGREWGYDVNELVQWLAHDKLLGKIGINFQLHKYLKSL